MSYRNNESSERFLENMTPSRIAVMSSETRFQLRASVSPAQPNEIF